MEKYVPSKSRPPQTGTEYHNPQVPMIPGFYKRWLELMAARDSQSNDEPDSPPTLKTIPDDGDKSQE